MKNNKNIKNNTKYPCGNRVDDATISNRVKKMMLMLFVFLSLGLAPHVFAQGFVPLAAIPGLTDIQPDAGGLASFFNNLYKYLIGLAAVLAIIEIIWGGLEISTKDSVSKQSDGKERITQAIFGLVLVLSPVLVFSIINPSILNLSLNLPPLELKFVPYKGSGAETTLTGPTPAGATDIIQDNKQYTDRFIQCEADGDCTNAKKSCNIDSQSKFQFERLMSVVCLKGKSIDPNGRTWFSLVPATKYECNDGGVANVKCIMQ